MLWNPTSVCLGLHPAPQMLQGDFVGCWVSPGPSSLTREPVMLTETSTKVALLRQPLVGSHWAFPMRLQACHGQHTDALLLVPCWKVLTCLSACRSASDAVPRLLSGSVASNS